VQVGAGEICRIKNFYFALAKIQLAIEYRYVEIREI
jgi:hypothetical protein